MLNIIVTDIFGKTPALNRIIARLSGEVKIVDPYEGTFNRFRDEAEAYSSFCRQGGLQSYTHVLCNSVKYINQPQYFIGFGIGAAALWRASAHPALSRARAGIAFYGAQIRHFAQISPRFPMTLVLPDYDTSYSVGQMVEKVSRHNFVTVKRTAMGEGFMNIQSTNYSSFGFEKYCRALARQSLYYANTAASVSEKSFQECIRQG